MTENTPEDAKAKRRDEIYKELGTLMQEWANVTHNENDQGVGGPITSCVIAFECVRYDENGNRNFRTDFLTLEPTSYTAGIGLLQDTLWSIHHSVTCHG